MVWSILAFGLGEYNTMLWTVGKVQLKCVLHMLVALPLGICYIMDRTKVTAKWWAHLGLNIVELVL